MRLYIVRHGDSLSSDIDPTQPLSKKGIQESEAVARFLLPASPSIEEIFHSGKKRAEETAEIMGRILAPGLKIIQKEFLKPNDPIDGIIQEIASYERNLMVVGHLPFLEKLIVYLLFGEEGKSPVAISGSCFVCLENIDGSWKIMGVISPKMLSIPI